MKPIEVSWHDGDIAVLALNGEHDLATKEELIGQLRALVRAGECVVVDLSQTTFIDSSVIHALVESDRMARERGRTLTLQLGMARNVRRTLEITGVLDLLRCVGARADAIQAAGSLEPNGDAPSAQAGRNFGR